MDNALLDSNFLYAVYDADDKYHERAMVFLEGSSYRLHLPEVVLPEVTFLLRQIGGAPTAAKFLDEISRTGMPLECIQWPDIQRARGIMLRHADAHLDFVDCAIVALAERLKISRICTFDRRDFSMIQPAHARYLELLP